MDSPNPRLMNRQIFIVAPHVCVGTNDQGCDVISHRAAIALYKAMGADWSILIKNKVGRGYKDQNRAEGYDEEMRSTLRRKAKSGDIVLEVHSFSTLDAFPGVRPATRLVILSTYKLGILSELEKSILETVPMTDAIQGSLTGNDISVEASQRGWNHVLLEFYDHLSKQHLSTIVENIKRVVILEPD